MDGYCKGNTGLPTILKTEPGKLDYTFDWSQWLAPLGETILAHTVTVGAGLTKVSDSATGTAVTVFVEDGENGVSYFVDCTITTATRREQRSIVITVAIRR